MRLLCVSDVHASSRGMKTVEKFCKKYEIDIMTIAGDLTHFGPLDFAREFFSKFEMPMVFVPGNCDAEEIIDVARDMGVICIHFEKKTLLGKTFCGFGGSVGWGDTSFSYTEEYVMKHLEPLITHSDIVLTHVPPYGVNDTVPSGKHLGSKALLELIKKYMPKIVHSGHVHESRGIAKVCSTTCINAGPAKYGMGSVATVNDDVSAELINP